MNLYATMDKTTIYIHRIKIFQQNWCMGRSGAFRQTECTKRTWVLPTKRTSSMRNSDKIKKDSSLELPFCLSGGYLLSQVVSNQVPSALRALTSVFGMVTGVSLLLLLPHFLITIILISVFWSSFRHISTVRLKVLLLLHLLPIYLVVFKVSYLKEILS